jgi:signal recognition particle receptor subunit alpha
MLIQLSHTRAHTTYTMIPPSYSIPFSHSKTTTTAKLAYHFQQKGLNSLLVAADTFRAGAVEQLRVHADCLGVPIYTAGYAKDPTDVVTQALQQLPTMTSTNNNNKPIDVVLIDTAGRMQTNAPLMQSMNKLIRTHTPDFTILVCEALVGSDALSQFQVFQKAAGKIDGLILTKVDTVDKKLGAALTLTQQSRTPVVFCGVGQKYHHLEPLDVDRVVRALLS